VLTELRYDVWDTSLGNFLGSYSHLISVCSLMNGMVEVLGRDYLQNIVIDVYINNYDKDPIFTIEGNLLAAIILPYLPYQSP
jgi:hypothetical protein